MRGAVEHRRATSHHLSRLGSVPTAGSWPLGSFCGIDSDTGLLWQSSDLKSTSKEQGLFYKLQAQDSTGIFCWEASVWQIRSSQAPTNYIPTTGQTQRSAPSQLHQSIHLPASPHPTSPSFAPGPLTHLLPRPALPTPLPPVCKPPGMTCSGLWVRMPAMAMPGPDWVKRR